VKQTFDLSRNTNTLRAVFSAIREIFEKGQYADKALERTFKLNRALKGAEKGFVAETVYDMVRYWRLLLTVAGLERPANDQHWWTLIGIYLIKKGYTPAGEKFSALKEEKILSRIRNYSRVRKISCSVPDWLDDLCSEELQDRWESVLKALNEPPSLIIRANSLKVTPEKLRELLL
jgi:16S rRNA (cytosine967-C5)-methyltransferase